VEANRETYIPLHNIIKEPNTTITLSNSHLSEFGVLGFEYGYALAKPNTLVMWEA
jgi:2-oxoglutarate dehydrogenase E1 component